jgi:hypothetical protein
MSVLFFVKELTAPPKKYTNQYESSVFVSVQGLPVGVTVAVTPSRHGATLASSFQLSGVTV